MDSLNTPKEIKIDTMDFQKSPNYTYKKHTLRTNWFKVKKKINVILYKHQTKET